MAIIYKRILILAGISLFLFYSGYLYTHLPVKDAGVTGQVAKGKLLWQQYNCGACHQVYGLGGYLGPDVTNSYSRRGPDYIKTFLKGGNLVMPNFHLDDSKMAAILAYLKNIDASGKADPRSYTINSNGTIEQ
jgi:nitric oxide reductase subunit C